MNQVWKGKWKTFMYTTVFITILFFFGGGENKKLHFHHFFFFLGGGGGEIKKLFSLPFFRGEK